MTTRLDDNNPIITDILNGKTTEHPNKKDLLKWAENLKQANRKNSTLKSFRIAVTLDDKIKEQAKRHNLTYTKYINIALKELSEKFDKLEAVQK